MKWGKKPIHLSVPFLLLYYWYSWQSVLGCVALFRACCFEPYISLRTSGSYQGDKQNVIQTSVISLLNPEAWASVDRLDKAPGFLCKPLWSAAPSFTWSVAFITQTTSFFFQRSVFPCFLYCFFGCFLFLVSLLGHPLCKHARVLHSELQACVVTNKTLGNKYLGQEKGCVFCVGF